MRRYEGEAVGGLQKMMTPMAGYGEEFERWMEVAPAGEGEDAEPGESADESNTTTNTRNGNST